ncbi:hypothetical protein DYB37_000251, partial [Aphanomyces astaci]
KSFHRFASQHGDFIHDMSFDFYGKRLATCSSDRKIKATASADGYIRMYEAANPMNLSEWTLPVLLIAPMTKLFISCRFDIPMLLVGGNSKTAKVWGFTVEKQWHVIAELAGHSDVIHDVAWAPNLGRSCHWLATASKDRTIRIWKLKINPNRQEQSEVVQVTTKDHGAFEVWRVQWNVTGTMLASTGDDGTVRMWQQDYKHQWQCVHAVSGDLA